MRSSRLAWVVTLALLALTVGQNLTAIAAAGGPSRRGSGPSYGVGEVVVRYTDHSRTLMLPGKGQVGRPIDTVIRYPIRQAGRVDVPSAVPAIGPFPLVVFGHGFAVTPAIYRPLMRAWVSAGYVVAAPIFPLANAKAPGGPEESDLVNQPRDMSLVITRVLGASAHGRGPLAGLIDPLHIAVAGQSDGGSSALDTAYDHVHPDRRVGAAVVLSGAELHGMDSFPFSVGSPPLLAVQGTADRVNFPRSTYRYFRLARRPKFLLAMLGAGHLGPYTDEQPQLAIVERETIAFLDRYLKHAPGARAQMWAASNVPGLARLSTRAPAPPLEARDHAR